MNTMNTTDQKYTVFYFVINIYDIFNKYKIYIENTISKCNTYVLNEHSSKTIPIKKNKIYEHKLCIYQ